jgi:Vacuolar sorting protein 9 (VPS9) domain
MYQYLTSAHIQKLEAANSDLMLSYLILTIIRTNSSRFYSNLKLTKLLRSPKRISGIEAYMLVNLESAYSFILAIDLTNRGFDQDVSKVCSIEEIRRKSSQPAQSTLNYGFNALSDLQEMAVGVSNQIWHLNLAGLMNLRQSPKSSPGGNSPYPTTPPVNGGSTYGKMRDLLQTRGM